MPSRFLKEIPSNLVINLGVPEDDDDDAARRRWICTAERCTVRQEARKNLYTGKTYNSLENVSQFFKERGVNVPVRRLRRPPTSTSAAASETGSATSARRAVPRTSRVTDSRQGGLFGDAPPGKNRRSSGKASRFRRRNRAWCCLQRPRPKTPAQQVQ